MDLYAQGANQLRTVEGFNLTRNSSEPYRGLLLFTDGHTASKYKLHTVTTTVNYRK